jgi:hypothetical protein
MAVLKPNDQIVHEFVIPFTIALKKWAAENSLQVYGPVEHRRVPGDAKHPEEGFVLFTAVEHIITHDQCEIGLSFGERFNKPIPETLDELNAVMKSVTDPLTDYFWPGKRKAEVVH